MHTFSTKVAELYIAFRRKLPVAFQKTLYSLQAISYVEMIYVSLNWHKFTAFLKFYPKLKTINVHICRMNLC